MAMSLGMSLCAGLRGHRMFPLFLNRSFLQFRRLPSFPSSDFDVLQVLSPFPGGFIQVLSPFLAASSKF